MRFLLLFLFSLSGFAQGLIVDPFKFGAPSSLNTSLIAYWKLDEASGTRVDSEPTGTAQDLTDNNTVTSNTGKLNDAAQFTTVNTEFLSRADSADLSVGDIGFSFTGWVMMDSLVTSQVLSKGTANTAAGLEYSLYYNSTTLRLECRVSNGTTQTIVTANNLGSPVVATWYFFVFAHDATANIISIQFNAGTADTASHTVGGQDTTGTFRFGASAGPASYWGGRIDEVAFYKKVLSAAEITALYGSGTPPACCPFTVIP